LNDRQNANDENNLRFRSDGRKQFSAKLAQPLLYRYVVNDLSLSVSEVTLMNSLHWQGRLDPFRELQREVGRLLEGLDPFQAQRAARQYPAINVHDAGESYVLAAQLPGVAPDDVELTITGETLTMRGERKRPEGVKDDSYRRQERPVGRWSRTITLPDRVDSAQVSATFTNGILTVNLPKAESAKPRHITVSSGS
jgi:HSP20 family protein